MPDIRPIEDLQSYDEISELCHRTSEPVFLTKDGNIDLVVMSIETYERLFGKVEINSVTPKRLRISTSLRSAHARQADIANHPAADFYLLHLFTVNNLMVMHDNLADEQKTEITPVRGDFGFRHSDVFLLRAGLRGMRFWAHCHKDHTSDLTRVLRPYPYLKTAL